MDRGGAGTVSFFLLTGMAAAEHVTFEWSLDCQQMKIYCVSAARCSKARTNLSLCCPHPILRFAQETAQDLILISLAQNENILRGPSCRKIAFHFAGIKIPKRAFCEAK